MQSVEPPSLGSIPHAEMSLTSMLTSEGWGSRGGGQREEHWKIG